MKHWASITGTALVIIVCSLTAFFFYKTVHTGSTTPPVALFGGVSLSIEYATTEAQREKGLGGRISIPDNYGMLFVFPRDDYYGFWMKDTLVPLDMFWLDDKGQVVSMAQDVATSTYPNVLYPSAPARYVLETAAGFAKAHAIATGTPLLLKNFPTVSE
ncbi:MAG: DUF192 domain-containing protein [Patescibacteria group bacterium]|nr:DUF192 domain-containing protein [Patescibacteria group bacterium]